MSRSADAVTPRQIAVEIVGDRGDDEQPEGCPARKVRRFQPPFNEEAENDQGYGHDAAIGEEIRDAVCAGGHGFFDLDRFAGR